MASKTSQLLSVRLSNDVLARIDDVGKAHPRRPGSSSHAIEGREDALVQKVKGACRLASGNVVPSAFSAYGLKLKGELIKELGGRNIVVHQGLMAPTGYDVERDLRRVALVRTMLVALIARSVGYRGAINGWEIGELGYPMEEQDWWQVSDEDRLLARRRFIAEERT